MGEDKPMASGPEADSESRQEPRLQPCVGAGGQPDHEQRDLQPRHALEVIRDSELSVRNSLNPPELIRRQGWWFVAIAVLGLLMAWQPGKSSAANIVWAVVMLPGLIALLATSRRMRAAASELRDETRSGVRRANASSDRQVTFGAALVMVATVAVTMVKGVPIGIQIGALALSAVLLTLLFRTRLPDDQQTPLRLFRLMFVIFAALALAVATNHVGQGLSTALLVACAVVFWRMAHHRSRRPPRDPEERCDEIRHTF